jgi:NTP-dependent ternary system trypsin peptidase co-occuring protein
MSARMIVELPEGKKVLFGGRGPETGLSEVGIEDQIVKVTSDRFQAALGSLSDLAAILERSVGQMARRPDKVEMEFGASLSADCNLWILSGEGKAEFKVKFGWERRE